ncbi:MAG: formate dehydrogenase accessory sulfurtransferase FdhD [Myxococcota bacterium]
MPGTSGSREIELLRLRPSGARTGHAPVAVEEPLEIRLNGRPVAITMRTPGDDAELALGFLVSEGILRDPAAVLSVVPCTETGRRVDVSTPPGAAGVRPPAARSFFATSSCGVCGKASLEALAVPTAGVHDDPLCVEEAVLCELPRELRAGQRLFEATGSLHAAALFDAEGKLACLREDVGRHNAVDKLIGWAAAVEALPLTGHTLMVSGRAGFEIVQKALVAGIPILAAISGPSTMAVELAREGGLTLIGFLRGEELNVYSHPERILRRGALR